MSDELPRNVARQVDSSNQHNTLSQAPVVHIFMQRSPQFPAGGPDRGIAGLDFTITEIGFNGAVLTTIKSTAPTGADGKIDVPVPLGGSAILKVLVNGNVVSEYHIKRADDIKPAQEIAGLEQRLRKLGYQIGHSPSATGSGQDDGADGRDPDQNPRLERSILDFLADEKLLPKVRAKATGNFVQGTQVQGYDIDASVLQTLTSRAGF
jgi:hypothetical protein